MKRCITLLLLAALTGCFTRVEPAMMAVAHDKCASNGGLELLRQSHNLATIANAYCVNGAVFRIEL